MAYTPTTWTEGVTTLGPTNMNKIETELVYLDTRIPAAAVSYGTTLPGSPVDGQEAILVDSTTSPTYQWRFRWNAGSSSAYKWEFVGGPALFATASSAQTLTAGSWAIVPGISLNVPRFGEYHCESSILLITGAGATSFAHGPGFSTGAGGAASSYVRLSASVNDGGGTAAVQVTATTAAALVLWGVADLTSVTIYTRTLSLAPIRVS